MEAGIRAYTESGDARSAIQLIGSALDVGNVPATVRPRAHVYMAHAFLALGDTASAVPHIEAALAAQPCLVPAEELTPPAWMALYERARPQGASCGRQAVTATLKSAFIPGWGQRTLGRPAASNYFLGSTLAFVGGAVFFQRRASDHYANYQTSTEFTEVAQLYSQAESARGRALILGGAAAAIYLWNIVDAARSGAAHDRGIAEVQNLAVVPVVAPTADGVAIAVHIPLR